MRPLKLFRRADERPPLKDRIAALKARLGRVTRRPDGGTDTHRRALMAGSLAAAVPLPALAGFAREAAHPDVAVIEAGGRVDAGGQAFEAASRAFSLAHRVAQAEIGPCPVELLLRDPDEDRGAFTWPGAPRCVRRGMPYFQWVDGQGEAWTADGLRAALRGAVAAYGPGGQTPHRCRRYRTLLPIAEAFDARRVQAETRHRVAELRLAEIETHKEWNAAQKALWALPATTPAGLAVIVRHVGECSPDRMPANWRNLLASAANVAGIDLASLDRAEAPRG